MLDGQKLKLGETEYTVPPLNLKAMRRLLPAISKLRTVGLPTDEDLSTIVDVVHSALLRNYPELTKDQVEEGIDMGNMKDALSVVLGQSGLASGNAAAAMTNLSTGESSSGTSSPLPDGLTTM